MLIAKVVPHLFGLLSRNNFFVVFYQFNNYLKKNKKMKVCTTAFK